MITSLQVTLVQAQLLWEDKKGNLDVLSRLIQPITSTDLIVLPEMFTTAFTMNSVEMAEKMDGPSVLWMKQKAIEKKAAICGSLIIEENSHYYNRFIWAMPNGDIHHYDKRHLFRMADEHQFFSAGNERMFIDYKRWKVCPMICYDLRFPVWSRNDKKAPYDLLIYVANWPSPRASAWSKLLMARAIENQAYVIGVNRVGEDEKGLTYSGGSAVIDPKGEALFEAPDNAECVKQIELDLGVLNAFRQKFPVGLDADHFDIK